MTSAHELEQYHAIGRLCVEGDRACANGDFAMLREITERLAERVEEPLHCELVALATTACDDVQLAAAWSRLKECVYREQPAEVPMTLREILRGAVADASLHPLATIAGASRLAEDLGLRSRSRIELAVLLERRLGTAVRVDQVMTANTVGDLERTLGV